MPTPAPKYLKAWVIFFLIATVGGAILGGFIAIILGLVMKAVFHSEMATIKTTIRIVTILVMVPLSCLTFRYVVQEFIVKELTPTPPPAPPAEPPIAK